MTPEQKLIQIVNNARGDDLERATRAFATYSDRQLDEQYGQSGQTPRQILAEYQRERTLYLQAQALLMQKLGVKA